MWTTLGQPFWPPLGADPELHEARRQLLRVGQQAFAAFEAHFEAAGLPLPGHPRSIVNLAVETTASAQLAEADPWPTWQLHCLRWLCTARSAMLLARFEQPAVTIMLSMLSPVRLAAGAWQRRPYVA